jgi:hypothetical protein
MSLLWLRVAVVLYGIAALAVLPAALYDRPRWRHIAVPAALAGVFFHFVSIVETLAAAHRALPVDTHETLSWLGLLLVVAFLLLAAGPTPSASGSFFCRWPRCWPSCLPSIRGTRLYRLPAVAHRLAPAAHRAAAGRLRSALYLAHRQPALPHPGAPPQAEAQHATHPGCRRSRRSTRSRSKSLLFGLPCMTAGLLIGSVWRFQTIGPPSSPTPRCCSRWPCGSSTC